MGSVAQNEVRQTYDVIMTSRSQNNVKDLSDFFSDFLPIF